MAMPREPQNAFVARLRDLLSTIESSSLVASVEARVRGLREQLQFACIAVPCDEALVALELEAFGRLHVPVVATPEGFRELDLQLLAVGTPFAYLLAGGDAHALSLEPDDPALAPLRDAVASSPRSCVLAPIRVGRGVVGGVMLLRAEASGDREVRLAQQLGDVLSLTVESFRTERALFELFARALPDVLGGDLDTRLGAQLERHVRAMRLDPAYRTSLRLALLCGRVASRGPDDAQLVVDVLERFDAYFRGLERVAHGGEGDTP